ncbi:MAG: tRNA (adenosine(37)-N6)-dimethylallyltransferase MiaA [Ruminococcaceae bacterium]|nr:tRNA (adenosine(37)-N6)-dimethylallyltransferase MiaA [Oscillospiraceae bacterium]
MEESFNPKRTKLLAVVGPTASGKTALAVRLAKVFGGEVISCDSMQVYRAMPISTAVPTMEERCGVPHHMMEILEPEETFSVAEYCKRAGECIDAVTARGVLPILCGGTGLYYNSLVDGIAFADTEELPELRERLWQRVQQEGGEPLLEQLREIDPETAARLYPADHKRIIRALEVYEATGIPLSEHNRRSREKPPRWELCVLGLDYRDRALLYDRINRRVDAMLEAGLLDEARRMMERGAGHTASLAIGCKEIAPYLQGQCTLEEAAERLKMETRRFAKRQLSWFRRDKRIQWIYVDDEESPEAALLRAEEIAKEFVYG